MFDLEGLQRDLKSFEVYCNDRGVYEVYSDYLDMTLPEYIKTLKYDECMHGEPACENCIDEVLLGLENKNND